MSTLNCAPFEVLRQLAALLPTTPVRRKIVGRLLAQLAESPGDQELAEELVLQLEPRAVPTSARVYRWPKPSRISGGQVHDLSLQIETVAVPA